MRKRLIDCVLGNYSTYLVLSNLKLLETGDSGSYCRCSRGANLPASPSNHLLASPACPDTCGLSSDGVLTAKSAGVSSVSRNLEFLGYLSEGGTITSTVFTSNTDLSDARCIKRIEHHISHTFWVLLAIYRFDELTEKIPVVTVTISEESQIRLRLQYDES